MKRAEFNIDTACVDVYVSEYSKKPKISIYTPAVDESLYMTAYTYSQVQKLIYDSPLEYAEMVLNDTLSEYVELCNKDGTEQSKNLKSQLSKHYEDMSETQVDMLVREYMMYDD